MGSNALSLNIEDISDCFDELLLPISIFMLFKILS